MKSTVDSMNCLMLQAYTWQPILRGGHVISIAPPISICHCYLGDEVDRRLYELPDVTSLHLAANPEGRSCGRCSSAHLNMSIICHYLGDEVHRGLYELSAATSLHLAANPEGRSCGRRSPAHLRGKNSGVPGTAPDSTDASYVLWRSAHSEWGKGNISGWRMTVL